MSEADRATCAVCRWWIRNYWPEWADKRYGACRRFPPSGEGTRMWPETKEDDWCGEHAMNPTATTEADRE